MLGSSHTGPPLHVVCVAPAEDHFWYCHWGSHVCGHMMPVAPLAQGLSTSALAL